MQLFISIEKPKIYFENFQQCGREVCFGLKNLWKTLTLLQFYKRKNILFYNNNDNDILIFILLVKG